MIYGIDCQVLVFYLVKNAAKSVKKYDKRLADKEKSRTFALPFEKRVADEAESSLKDWREKIKIEKFCKKIWKFKNNAYLCSPVRKTGY